MKELKLFSPQNGLDFRFGKIEESLTAEDVVFGMSLGALVVLRESASIPGKIVLINPPLPRRSIFVWLGRWLRMTVYETPFNNRQKFTKNPLRFAIELVRCIKLLSTDFDAAITTLPKERLTVIRGRQDCFFTDNTATAYLRDKGVFVVEVEGGHNWNIGIENEALKRIKA